MIGISRMSVLLSVILLFALVGAAGSLARTVQGAALTVDSTADSIAHDGACTLREAIINANNDDQAGSTDCPAGSGADIINLPAGTYILAITGMEEDAAATGDLDIEDDLTIIGEGRNLTVIDGGGIDRVVDISSEITIEISGVTVENGNCLCGGGGISNEGTLTITNSAVNSNKASSGGGIYNGGRSAATMNLINVTVAGNTAGAGGGIVNGGTSAATMNLINVTVSGNTASQSQGGGIVIVDPGSKLDVINSTISGNSAVDAGGGFYLSAGLTNLTNSTVTNNTASKGGGLDITTGLILSNTLVTGNTASDGGDCSGFVISRGYNLDSDNTCTLTEPTDITGTDPLLGPLQDNGGPTVTHALLPGSPAIDHIPPTDCTDDGGNPVTTDQRGVTRPQGTACDIGAFEFEEPLAAEAAASFDSHQDLLDGATGFKLSINQITEPATGSVTNVLLGGFQARLTYHGSCVSVLGVRGIDFAIADPIIDNIAGVATFGGSDVNGVPWPADLGHVLTRLSGSIEQDCQMDLEFISLSDVEGKVIAAPTVFSQTVLRGDARADGNITIDDALFIAKYLVGLTDACTTVVDTSCLHSVNAASVQHDGSFDQITIADALLIAQFLVGSKDEFYTPVLPAQPRCDFPPTGPSDDTPFFAGLPPTILMAEGILLQAVPNLHELHPVHQQLLKELARHAAHTFELLAALGQLGELTCPDNTALLGGDPVRDRLEPWVIAGLQGIMDDEPLQRLMQDTIVGLQGPPEIADRVIWALRITDEFSARDAYRGFFDAFVIPTSLRLPGYLREGGVDFLNREFEQLVFGRSVLELDPASFIQALLDGGVVF